MIRLRSIASSKRLSDFGSQHTTRYCIMVNQDEILHARRVIEGRTLNTETSQLVATATWDRTEFEGKEGVLNLYQSRQGQFFEVAQESTTWKDPESGWRTRTTVDVCPLDDQQARRWAELHEAEIINDVFALLDEGERPAAEETLLLRM